MKNTKNHTSRVAILVFACDRYELLFKGFTFFFNKYWDHTSGIKKYFATEKNTVHIDDFINLKSGNGPWTNRLKKILDQINEDYIIFFQEDMWLKQKVMSGVIEKLCEYAINNDLKLIKLHSSPAYKTTNIKGVDFDGLKLGKIELEASDYLMSHQISIWNKDFLKKQLKDNEHPWRNERKGTKRLRKSKEQLFLVDVLSENNGPEVNQNKEGAIRGAYDTVSVNACVHEKAKPFIHELKSDFPKYAEKLLSHMENEITHDGKPKPRKEDLAKKVRKKIKAFFGK